MYLKKLLQTNGKEIFPLEINSSWFSLFPHTLVVDIFFLHIASPNKIINQRVKNSGNTILIMF